MHLKLYYNTTDGLQNKITVLSAIFDVVRLYFIGLTLIMFHVIRKHDN